jgi:hypothetical protein
MDILGLTFAEVRSALAPRVHEVKKLREEYRLADRATVEVAGIHAAVGSGAMDHRLLQQRR